ncbi:hypothetical protein O9K80_001055 [Escherichia coli]|nr:hypothetical protein [Escherichia coli]
MLPFNIASYAALLHIVADMCELVPGDLIFSGGNTHIYSNHIEQCKEILNRTPMDLCKLSINWPNGFSQYDTETQMYWLTEYMTARDFVLKDYQSHGVLKGKMAV